MCTSTTGILEPGTSEQLATEERLASPSQFKGPYKRSKFRGYLEVKKRADAGWPIATTLPTAPIGPHDLRPTPTGMIVVAFLKGRIPLLARTGLNFVDVRDCALGHLLAMARGKSGERYLLGGINLWLCDFLKRVEPYARYRTPRFYAPHWLRFLTACASETAARIWPNWTPFVTREAVQMSRGPHFPVTQKRKTNSVIFLLPRSTPPFMMRWKISSRAASCQLLPADFLQRKRGRDFFEPRIATKRIPKSQGLQVAITEVRSSVRPCLRVSGSNRLRCGLLNLQSRAPSYLNRTGIEK